MRKQLILASICLILAASSHAQQTTSFSHSYYSSLLYNPSFAGIGDQGEIIGLSRMQWAGSDQVQSSNLITAGIPLAKHLAIGTRLSSEKLGLFNTNEASVIVAYHLPLDHESFLSLGIGSGISRNSVSLARLNAADADDHILVDGDLNSSVFKGDVGINYRNARFDVGLAANGLIGQTELNRRFSQADHKQFIVSAGYKFTFGQAVLEPRTIFKTRTEFQGKVETMLTVYLKETFWAGCVYRFEYGPAFYAGCKFGARFRTGYAYELAPVGSAAPIGPAHELFLSYQFLRMSH